MYELVPADREFCLLVECATMREYLEPFDFAQYSGWFPFNPETFRAIRVAGREAGVLQVTRREASLWVLERLLILPVFQGRGVGTRVLQDLLARADAEGATVELEAFASNPSRRLYERLGFRAAEGITMRRSPLGP